ncbi:MAG TPA: class I SAM-dependent methyltransferase [Puia sp.]|nr:class I SAM-dependent methyltransferase [Puia sp.]
MKESLLLQKKLDAFEAHYHSLRLAERRIYSNEEIANLPDISMEHPHYREWLIRKKSSERFINYLKSKKRKLNILEAGCGNGWLAAKMSNIHGTKVTGIDINKIELMQAVTVFERKENLHFVYGSIDASVLAENSYDIIVFASSLQYFSSLFEIIHASLKLVSTEGEIHILDTLFYNAEEINNASKRTEQYYAGIGFQQMNEFYFHHSLSDLKHFSHKILYNPSSILNRFKRKDYPFPWIMIHK